MLQSLLGLDFTIPALGDILTPVLQAHFGNESFPCDFLPGIKAVLNTTILQQSVLDSVAGSPCASGRLLRVVGPCPQDPPFCLSSEGFAEAV